MTAPEVNTEFSLTEPPPVKAEHVEFVVIGRCEVGNEIISRRSRAVNAANIEEWWKPEAEIWMEYCRHLKACDQCWTYQIAKNAIRNDPSVLADLPKEETK